MTSSLLPDGVTDPYEVLGTTRDASAKEVRKAYRRRAREIHPDKRPDDPDAEVNFHRLQNAFEFLEDDKKRFQYDELLRKDDERRVRYEKQTVEKRKFAEKLEKAEQQTAATQKTATTSSSINTSAEQLRKDQLRRAREENEEWLQQHQHSKTSSTGRASTTAQKSAAADAVGQSDSCSNSASSPKAFVEVKWGLYSSQFPLGLTRAALKVHFAKFNNPVIHYFDFDKGEAILGFSSRESALEAAVYFMKNKQKYPFTVKFLKHPPPLNAATPGASSRIDPSTGQPSTQQPSTASCSHFPPTLEEAELDVLSRLRQEVKRQKQSS